MAAFKAVQSQTPRMFHLNHLTVVVVVVVIVVEVVVVVSSSSCCCCCCCCSSIWNVSRHKQFRNREHESNTKTTSVEAIQIGERMSACSHVQNGHLEVWETVEISTYSSRYAASTQTCCSIPWSTSRRSSIRSAGRSSTKKSTRFRELRDIMLAATTEQYKFPLTLECMHWWTDMVRESLDLDQYIPWSHRLLRSLRCARV